MFSNNILKDTKKFWLEKKINKIKIGNRIGSAMISVLVSSAIYCGFEPRLDQTKEYTIWICCFSAKLRIGIMCPSGAKYLPAACCFSELALYKSNSACWSRTKRTSSSSHWILTWSHHDIAENFLNWRLTTITHSLT